MYTSLFYAKREYSVFQLLVRAKRPHAVCFVPEYDADCRTKSDYKEVLTGQPVQPLHENSQKRKVKRGTEDGVEEVAGKQQFAQFHVMSQHANFDFVDEEVVSAQLLLFD